MNANETRYEITRLLRRYRSIRLLETILVTAAGGLLIYSIVNLILNRPGMAAITAATFTFVTTVLRVRQLRLFQIDEQSIINFVNRHYPQMQESGDLLFRDENELTTLEQLQQIRTAHRFNELRASLRLPHQLPRALLACIGCVIIASAAIPAMKRTYQRMSPGISLSDSTGAPQAVALPASVSQLDLDLSPPAYTHIHRQLVHAFPIVAPEGSIATWTIEFAGQVKNAELIFNGNDTLILHPSGTAYRGQTTLEQSGFYQLSWEANEQKKFSDFYSVQIRKDTPPVLKIDHPDQFIQLEPSAKLTVDMKATLTDDYGLTDAYIVATVSKGSGEGIKFREERLRFDSPVRIAEKKISAARRIDLIKLGLDPGDELYYYVEAFDNKAPVSNKARTETYFIVIKDTAAMTTSVDPGLGIDLMPEYFRSQRQIIIDSEKLLKDKAHISRDQFNSRSNELAHDEKVLRLRYGEFLGEEFESSIGPAAGIDPPTDTDTDIAKLYGHQHDTDEEHAARADPPSGTGASHKHAHSADHDHNADKDADPAKAYMHAHDSDEEATFFTQSIQAKLKAAVAIMWDAELHLRLNAPGKSLPYQYRALKLLKEISQDSRIYVHRTGFDPPPLKEEKRLTGDLAEIKSNQANSHTVVNSQFPAIRQALGWLESTSAKQHAVDPGVRELLLRAGNELSAAALEQPGRYLDALSRLRAYADNDLDETEQHEAVRVIRAAFYNVLPKKAQLPSAQHRTTHPLDDAFLREYELLSKPLVK